MDQFSNYKDIFGDFVSLMSSFLQMGRGMRLRLSPRLHKALSKLMVPITRGIEKQVGSFCLGGSLF